MDARAVSAVALAIYHESEFAFHLLIRLSPMDTYPLNFIAYIRIVTRSFLAVLVSGSIVSTAVNRGTVKSRLALQQHARDASSGR
ncbi:hypothetical protein P0D88_15475 [Paraburkholderia sp. RL18-103-BIB-C]|jgi:hypothetical protein|uniref:hypothetical protein n=1 Tax=unclassified Paraburkholderia TaxID=2615204 RepID=UPI0038B7A28A